MKWIDIKNVNVYGLNESLVASGYPMLADTGSMREPDEKDFNRCCKLGSAKSGSGHDCSLKGIIVQFDLTMSQYMWQQAKRYHWFDFVSSTSTMHRITKMNIENSCNRHVSMHTIILLKQLVEMYNSLNGEELSSSDKFGLELIGVDFVNNKQDLFHAIISNIPSGFLLTSRMTTNYLQLKTMYHQRKHHKLYDWREFCEWCESLPMFKELIRIEK